MTAPDAAPRFAPARTLLRAIDPAQATVQSQVIEALGRRVAGEYVLEARFADADHASAWIVMAAAGVSDTGEIRVSPLLADGAMPLLTDGAGRPDVALAAVALGAIEPIVAAAELAIGSALRPTMVVPATRPEAVGLVSIVVEAWRHGACLHRALLSLPTDMRIRPAAALPFAGASTIAFAPGWTASLAGPALSAGRFAAMARGDLLLLGIGGNVARFTPPGRSIVLAARLDVQQGVMIMDQEIDAAPALVTDASPHTEAGEISVPISIEFDGGGLTLERLATLGVGSVVVIPAASGGVLPVRVLAGGTRVASGELVAVGDGFGVLITSLEHAQAQAQSPAQPQAQPQAQPATEPPAQSPAQLVAEPRAEPQPVEG